MAFNGKAPFAPDYASYNWVGAPANYDLTTNTDLGGDSRMQAPAQLSTAISNIASSPIQASKM